MGTHEKKRAKDHQHRKGHSKGGSQGERGGSWHLLGKKVFSGVERNSFHRERKKKETFSSSRRRRNKILLPEGESTVNRGGGEWC